MLSRIETTLQYHKWWPLTLPGALSSIVGGTVFGHSLTLACALSLKPTASQADSSTGMGQTGPYLRAFAPAFPYARLHRDHPAARMAGLLSSSDPCLDVISWESSLLTLGCLYFYYYYYAFFSLIPLTVFTIWCTSVCLSVTTNHLQHRKASSHGQGLWLVHYYSFCSS